MRLLRLFVLMIFATNACSGIPSQAPAPYAISPTQTRTAFLSPAPETSFPPTATRAAAPTTGATSPIPEPTPPSELQVCSPLQGYALEQIQAAIANPYHPPRPGSDDPHHGIDIADTRPGEHIALAGRAVQAVLAGQVALALQDRFPYGNAILIETPLDLLPDGWADSIPLPTLAPTIQPLPNLTCPGEPVQSWDFSRRSLYLLYAHMGQAPALKPDDQVTCGQIIGAVGNSGNALNPHLHLEARLGPSGWRPASLAHYDSSARLEEMENYCTWRVRGIFQLLDPLTILAEP